MCYGDPKVTDTARCLTANYSKSRMSHRKAERSGVLLIQEATKKGYKEANVGDSINLGFAGSKTRRGRVGKDIAHTLESVRTQGVITPGSRIRRLTPRSACGYKGSPKDKSTKYWPLPRIRKRRAGGNLSPSTSSTPRACVSRRWMTS